MSILIPENPVSKDLLCALGTVDEAMIGREPETEMGSIPPLGPGDSPVVYTADRVTLQ